MLEQSNMWFMVLVVGWGSDIPTLEADVMGFEVTGLCWQQAPGMSLQGRKDNGLEEMLYPQGDLQLAKQEDIPSQEGLLALSLACLLLGHSWGVQYFPSYRKGGVKKGLV